MADLWWLELVGFFMLLTGGWRLLWRFPLIVGLFGANKLGTAKDEEQVETNKANIEAMKEGIPLALFLFIVGGILIYFF